MAINKIWDKTRILDISFQPSSEVRKKQIDNDKIRALTGDNKEDRAQLEELKKAIESRLDEARETIKQIREEFDNTLNRKLRLEIEEDLHIVIAKIIDAETNEVIRQIPIEELIELSKKFKEIDRGVLLDTEV